jgi:transposase-like protein
VDETYLRVAGVWCYAYRAIDEDDQVIDVYVSPTRDQEAAMAFFRQALQETAVTLRLVTTDKAAAYPPALREVLPGCAHETGKAPQQRIERDHQHLKGRLRPMRGSRSRAAPRLSALGTASPGTWARDSIASGSSWVTPRFPGHRASCGHGTS